MWIGANEGFTHIFFSSVGDPPNRSFQDWEVCGEHDLMAPCASLGVSKSENNMMGLVSQKDPVFLGLCMPL